MKKFFLLILLINFAIMSCGDSEQSESNTITFWHFWSEPSQVKVLKAIVEKFEIENNCNVELNELSWNDGKTKLFAAFNSKTAPDVLELGSDWVAQFSSAGVLLELPSNEFDLNQFIDFAQSPAEYNHKVYCLPWIVDTRVLFYNEELLYKATNSVKPPDNYLDLLTVAEKINNMQGFYGYGANGADRHRLYKKIIPMFWSYGGNIFKNNNELILNSPANIKALEMYVDLSRNGLIETQRLLDAVFTEGKLGFVVSGGWLVDKIKNENPNLRYNVALMPKSNEHSGVSFAGGEYLAISKQSKNIELSKKLIKYLADGKNSLELCKQVTEAGFPADKNYFEDEFYKSNPRKSIFSEQLKQSKMTPVHPKWLDIESYIEEATVEVLLGKKSAAEALTNAQNEISNLIQKK